MTGTNLTNQQLTDFEGVLKKFKGKYPKINEMFDAISKLENKPKVYLSSEETKGNVGRYDQKTNTIYYRDGTALGSDGGLEEFIHVAQYQICYSNENPSVRNIEFEAKMFYDLNCVIAGDLPSWSTRGISENAQMLLSDFMETLTSTQHLTSDLLQIYHELGKQWNDPDYQIGKYNDSIGPKLIQTFYK